MSSSGRRFIATSQCSASREMDMGKLLGKIKEKDRKIEQDLGTIQVMVADRLPSLIKSVQLNENSVSSLLELTESRDILFQRFITEAGCFVRSLEKNAILYNKLPNICYPTEAFKVEHDILEKLIAKATCRLEEMDCLFSAEQKKILASEKGCEEITLKLVETENDLQEIKDKIQKATEEQSSMENETPKLEQHLCDLTAKVTEMQIKLDDQNIEHAKRTQKNQEILAEVQKEYEAVCKEISEDRPRSKERVTRAQKRLDEILAEMEATSKKIMACEEEKRRKLQRIEDLEQNLLNGLRKRRDAAKKKITNINLSVQPLRSYANTFRAHCCNLEQLLERLVHVSYSRADHLNHTLAKLIDESQSKVNATQVSLPARQWSSDDFTLHDPCVLLRNFRAVGGALKAYLRSDIIVKHSTAQTDFQLEDVLELERISEQNLCEVTQREIIELKRSLQQIEANRRRSERELQFRTSGSKGSVSRVDFKKLPTLGRSESDFRSATFPKSAQLETQGKSGQKIMDVRGSSSGYIKPRVPISRTIKASNIAETIVISSESESNNKDYLSEKYADYRRKTYGLMRSIKHEKQDSVQPASSDRSFLARTHSVAHKEDHQFQMPTKTSKEQTYTAKYMTDRQPQLQFPSSSSEAQISSQWNTSSLKQKRQMALSSIRATFKENIQSSDDSELFAPAERYPPNKKAKRSDQSATPAVVRVKPVQTPVLHAAASRKIQKNKAIKRSHSHKSDVDLISEKPVVSLLDSD